MLQVSDAFQNTLQLRALMDARNSSDAWDLRCYVREKLVDFLQKNYPGSLPRTRAEVETKLAFAGQDNEPELRRIAAQPELAADNRLGNAPQHA